uniref:Uncharacterized protein n=1 Tax=Strongyloides venezuelensis TaxID=75913 RepID=A0A0K0F1P4_STRVS
MPKVRGPFFGNLKIASYRINNIKNDKGISLTELFLNFMPRTLQDNKYNIQNQYNVQDMRHLYKLLHSLEKLAKEIVVNDFDLNKTKAENRNVMLKNEFEPINRTAVMTSGGRYVN